MNRSVPFSKTYVWTHHVSLSFYPKINFLSIAKVKVNLIFTRPFFTHFHRQRKSCKILYSQPLCANEVPSSHPRRKSSKNFFSFFSFSISSFLIFYCVTRISSGETFSWFEYFPIFPQRLHDFFFGKILFISYMNYPQT